MFAESKRSSSASVEGWFNLGSMLREEQRPCRSRICVSGSSETEPDLSEGSQQTWGLCTRKQEGSTKQSTVSRKRLGCSPTCCQAGSIWDGVDQDSCCRSRGDSPVRRRLPGPGSAEVRFAGRTGLRAGRQKDGQRRMGSGDRNTSRNGRVAISSCSREGNSTPSTARENTSGVCSTVCSAI